MKKVIDSGYTIYAECMGRDYLKGQNVEKDVERATQYFAYGAERGDIRCKLILACLHITEKDSDDAMDKARNLLQSVCEDADVNSEEYNQAKSMLEKIELE